MKGKLIIAGLALASLAGAQSQTEAALAQGLVPFLWLCFLGGLLALLTPCVFPMVPVTVSYFSKRTDSGAKAAAVVYCLGIVSAFAVVGVATSVLLKGSDMSIVTFATNPWVNIALAVLFVVLALNLFGLYEIQLPSGLVNAMNKKSRSAGWLGPLLMGTTFALTTFTCTAPIVGGLLIASTQGSILYPALGMTAFGVAFALPFLGLALFPSYISNMPKSGSWLAAVKPALGIIELMAALKFLSNAELVWELGILTRPVFLAIWAVLTFILAAYLFGIPKNVNKIGWVRRGLAVGSMALGVFFSVGAAGQPIKGDLGAFLPPDPYPFSDQSRVAEKPVDENAPKEIQWGDSFEAGLEIAKAENKVVFIDFTGVTCVNCRLMEQDIFPDPGVEERFGEMVTLKLYTDRDTDADRANQELQKELANTIALPVYVLVRPDGTVIDKFEGLSRSPEEFIQFLDKGKTDQVASR